MPSYVCSANSSNKTYHLKQSIRDILRLILQIQKYLLKEAYQITYICAKTEVNVFYLRSKALKNKGFEGFYFLLVIAYGVDWSTI